MNGTLPGLQPVNLSTILWFNVISVIIVTCCICFDMRSVQWCFPKIVQHLHMILVFKVLSGYDIAILDVKLIWVLHTISSPKISSEKNSITAWKVSKYGVISGPYFPVFGLNTEIYIKFPYSVRIQKKMDKK